MPAAPPWSSRVAIVALLAILSSCGLAASDVSQDVETSEVATGGVLDVVDPDCVLPADPVTVFEDQGLLLKVWTFALEEVHTRPVLPNEPGLLAYRAAIRSERAVERHPALYVPPAQDEAEAELWRDEHFNNDLAYRDGVGSIEPIICLDALLFAEQNVRVPQLERPTEFLASVLRRRTAGRDEVAVVFGAGREMFPPKAVYGFETIDEHLAQGWRYWYVLHNHTRQADGALGVPVPSTVDVRFSRSLAEDRGLERVRVTNGFYSFDAAIDEIAGFRAR